MAFDPYLDWLEISPGRRPPSVWDLLGLEQGPIELEVLHKAAADRLESVRRYANSPQPEVSEAALRIQGELSRALMELERLALPAAKPETPSIPPRPVVEARRLAAAAPVQAPASGPADRKQAGGLRPAGGEESQAASRPTPTAGTVPMTAEGSARRAEDIVPDRSLRGRILIVGSIVAAAALLIAAFAYMNGLHRKALAEIEAAAQSRQAAITKQEADRKRAEEEAARKPAESAPRPAIYKVRIEPAEATLTVSDKEAKIESAGQQRTVTIARPDARTQIRLVAAMAGYQSREELIRLAPGELREVTIRLERRNSTIANSIGMKLVLIPAGEFTMGSPDSEDDQRSDEGPQHRVRITKPFYLGQYEVTQGEYQRVMGTNPSYFKQVSGQDTSRFPVEQVSWSDALEFCRKLTQKEARTYRLPTEAEWEYACRAGTTTPFSFGTVLNGRQANCDGNYPYGTRDKGPFLRRPTTVGSYGPNAFGLYDMHGNVWEWCADWYAKGYYATSPADDPQGPDSGSLCVLRGGSWFIGPNDARSAYRIGDSPLNRSSYFGFRVAHVPADSISSRIPAAAESAPRPAIYKVLIEPAEATLTASDKEAKIEGAGQQRTVTIARPDARTQIRLVAAMAGYQSREELIRPAPGDLREVTIRLERTEPASPKGTPVATITNSIGMKLVLIPAGEFTMGSPDSEDDQRSDEGPQHRVRITKPFYLGQYEVTQAEYQRLMGTNPSRFKQVSGQDTSRFPVEQVSWSDALEFCRKLTQKEGRTYRLPTEAEWEYACRAGTTTPFSFGTVLNGRQANCDGNFPYGTRDKGPYMSRPTTVGSYSPNAFGLHDMHGNVWEWCADWYGKDYYAASPLDAPKGPGSGTYRVLRGGSWGSRPNYVRSAFRYWSSPLLRIYDSGFRVARTE